MTFFGTDSRFFVTSSSALTGAAVLGAGVWALALHDAHEINTTPVSRPNRPFMSPSRDSVRTIIAARAYLVFSPAAALS